MASSIIRAGFFGWGGIAGEKAATAVPGGVALTITYARPLRTAPAFAQFTATVNGVARGVTAASVSAAPNDGRLNLTLAAGNLVAGDRVVITYTPGGTAGTRLAYAGTPAEEFPAGSTELVAG